MADQDFQAALDYHEATKHSEWSVRTSRHFLDWENQPYPFKLYRNLEPIPLLRDLPPSGVPALEGIAASAAGPRVEDGEECLPDFATLSRLLQLSAGIIKRKRYPGGEIFFRAYPNTGALYHIDLYLVAGDLPDLSAGVYHFGPHDFSLRRLRAGDYREVLVEASGQNPDVARAPVVIVSASTYWRNAWKYEARAYRHCFWDAGTLHANLLAVGAAERLQPHVVLGYADRPVEALLGLDPLREGALTLVPLGWSRRLIPHAPEIRPLRLETEPLSPAEVDYPTIREFHGASSLAGGAEAAAWRSAGPTKKDPAASGPLFPLRPRPDPALSGDSLDAVIRRRGSTRAFDRNRPISLRALSTVLTCATCGVPADFLNPPGASLLDLYLIVHAVEDLAPGAYAFRRETRSIELLRQGNFRHAAGRLGLSQELPADAAVNIYSLAHLPRALARLGNRGYRAVQLEGGIAGGRMYLGAYSQRFGATGLTFFDDEVTDFFSPHALGKSVLFLVALGHAARRTSSLGRESRA